MTKQPALSSLALTAMALPVIAGAWLCFVRPERAGLWVLAMLFVPAVRLGIRTASRALGTTRIGAAILPARTVDAQKMLSGAIVVASLVVALPLAANLADALGLIDASGAHAIATRWTNVLAGGYFVFHGNRLPKILTPLSGARHDLATMQTVQFRTGRLYVLAGSAYAVVWLVLPAHLAQPYGLAIMVTGILVPSAILRSYARRGVAHPGR